VEPKVTKFGEKVGELRSAFELTFQELAEQLTVALGPGSTGANNTPSRLTAPKLNGWANGLRQPPTLDVFVSTYKSAFADVFSQDIADELEQALRLSLEAAHPARRIAADDVLRVRRITDPDGPDVEAVCALLRRHFPEHEVESPETLRRGIASGTRFSFVASVSTAKPPDEGTVIGVLDISYDPNLHNLAIVWILAVDKRQPLVTLGQATRALISEALASLGSRNLGGVLCEVGPSGPRERLLKNQSESVRAKHLLRKATAFSGLAHEHLGLALDVLPVNYLFPADLGRAVWLNDEESDPAGIPMLLMYAPRGDRPPLAADRVRHLAYMSHQAAQADDPAYRAYLTALEGKARLLDAHLAS
jgi:hypothetical protein